jgi:hypothetical protein
MTGFEFECYQRDRAVDEERLRTGDIQKQQINKD